MDFEWDPDKAALNLDEHRVSFEDAKTVFFDPRAITISDELHSTEDEERVITIGLSANRGVLVVVSCEREDRIRIISARRAANHEKKQYEEDA